MKINSEKASKREKKVKMNTGKIERSKELEKRNEKRKEK